MPRSVWEEFKSNNRTGRFRILLRDGEPVRVTIIDDVILHTDGPYVPIAIEVNGIVYPWHSIAAISREKY